MSSAPQDNAESGERDSTPDAAEPVSDPPAAVVDIQVKHAGRTSVGLVREHNEDNFVIANLDVDEPSPRDQVSDDDVGPHGMLFAVCDGMGGAAAGEVASQMAVDILLEALRRGGPPAERDDLARRLVAAVQEAGKRIFAEAQKERTRRGMGTTATVAVLLDKVLFIAEVGDSRAYLLRNGVLKQLTKDQSLVNQLIEAGHLTEEEAEAFEHSNIILQALGTSESVQVDLTFVELRRHDRLMLCSDGLSGLVHDESIRDALQEVRDPGECANLLVEYAEAGGGHDNITVIVADFAGEGLAPAGAEDAFGYVQYPLLPESGAPDPLALEEAQRAALASETSRRSLPGGRPGQPAKTGGGWVWLLTGLLTLGAGASFLALSASEPDPGRGEADNVDREDELPAAAAPAVDPRFAFEPSPEELETPVSVRIHTDVEHGTLMVNGEAIGPLLAGESYPLKLKPGAYRFEAEADGNVTAVSVVTVRPGQSMDVYLNLPRGEQAGGKLQGVADAATEEAPGTTEEEASGDQAVADAVESATGSGHRAESANGEADGADELAAAGDKPKRAASRKAGRARAKPARRKAVRAAASAEQTEPVIQPPPATKDQVASQAVAEGSTKPNSVQMPPLDEDPPVMKISRERPAQDPSIPKEIPDNPYSPLN